MRRTVAIALVIALALLIPALAYAGIAATRGPLVIEPATMRAGDVYRFVESATDAGPEGEETTERLRLLAYEGPSQTLDGFGRIRDTDMFRVEGYDDNGTLYNARRCHIAQQTAEVIVVESTAGTYSSWSMSGAISQGLSILGETGTLERETNYTTFFGPFAFCAPIPLNLPARMSEGEMPRMDALFPELSEEEEGWKDLVPDPARRATFHGRDALLISYDIREMFAQDDPEEAEGIDVARLEFVFAADLPVIAEMRYMLTGTDEDGQSHASHGSVRLDGYVPGDGSSRQPVQRASTPAPEGATIPAETFTLDDFGLPYPYSEAVRDALADPTVGLARWLAQHPDAILTQALYDRTGRHPLYGDRLDTDGGWGILFTDGQTRYAIYVVRARGPEDLPASPVGRSPYVHVDDRGTFDSDPVPHPTHLINPAHALDMAQAQGFDIEAIGSLTYSIQDDDGEPAGFLILDEIGLYAEGDQNGKSLLYSATDGALVALGQTDHSLTTDSPLGPLAGGGELPEGRDDRLAAFSALVGPVPGAGLGAGAAATGLALLLVAVKFGILPFFTRLVRSRLLDHPVRARLFERVRLEPGIRLAELIDYAAIGEGATRRHLDQLVKHGFLVELRDGVSVAYYVSGDVPRDRARQASLLRSDNARRVYDLYAARPDASLREAAAALGMSAPSVHRIKKKLEDGGLLPASVEANVAVA